MPLTVVRKGEWPFEPGSKAIEKLQSAHVFKKLDVAETNEYREALGGVVESKEMPHVYTTMSGGTFSSDEAGKPTLLASTRMTIVAFKDGQGSGLLNLVLCSVIVQENQRM